MNISKVCGEDYLTCLRKSLIICIECDESVKLCQRRFESDEIVIEKRGKGDGQMLNVFNKITKKLINVEFQSFFFQSKDD